MTEYVFEPKVTEEEWLGEERNLWRVWCSMPHPKKGKALDRKKLLLVAHLVRQVADQLTDPRFAEAIEAGERAADGLITEKEAWAAQERAVEAYNGMPHYPDKAAKDAANVAQRYFYEPNETAEMVVGAVASRAAHLARHGKHVQTERIAAENAIEALIRRLIIEVHGNPFRPVTFSPSWRTDTAVSLARTMYESREFGAMLILADALQDAGCDNDDILSHCRDPKPVHVRGCWVLDLVLAKNEGAA